MKSQWIMLVGGWFLLHAGMAAAAEPRPNVLWITGEDMRAQWLGCYGNPQIKTPNFDRFAQEGFLYTNCYAHTPVCAPSRSGWITGIHPVSTGTIYMRIQNAPPAALMWYPDALRANGYYPSNFTKTDHNTSNRRAPGFGGGENQGSVGHFLDTWDAYESWAWKSPNRRPDQPFFQVNNSAGCHESYHHRFRQILREGPRLGQRPAAGREGRWDRGPAQDGEARKKRSSGPRDLSGATQVMNDRRKAIPT